MSTEKKVDGRKNNGGARKGAGRKRLPHGERKTLVGVFVSNKYIKKKGGIDASRELILNTLEKD